MIEDWTSLVKLGLIQHIIGAAVVVFIAYFGFLKNMINPRSGEKGAVGGEVTYQPEHGQSSLNGWQRFIQNLAIIIISSLLFGYVFTVLSQKKETSKYTVKVCGKITDENGHGIEGATFNLFGFKKIKTNKEGVFSTEVEINQADTTFEYRISATNYNDIVARYDTSVGEFCDFSQQLKKLK